MPTEKPKIIFVADEDLFKRIDDFRFDNRINTRSEAIRRLIDKALKMNEAFPDYEDGELLKALKKVQKKIS
ncbi:MAG: hypothetical protein ABIE47_13135 [Pseudomonadota bacterium]